MTTLINYHWSCVPGKFVNKLTGKAAFSNSIITPGPAFHGTASEWFETLVETITDVKNAIGGADTMLVGFDAKSIFDLTCEGGRGTIRGMNVVLNPEQAHITIYDSKDPRNKCGHVTIQDLDSMKVEE